MIDRLLTIASKVLHLLAEALWALGDGLGHVERGVYAVARKSNDVGHAVFDRGTDLLEDRDARRYDATAPVPEPVVADNGGVHFDLHRDGTLAPYGEGDWRPPRP